MVTDPASLSASRLARLRKLCLRQAGATEKQAWGDPTWRANDRIFAMQKGNSKGARPSLWLNAPDGVQGMLVAGDPAVFFVPPYVGKYGWIGIYLDSKKLNWTMLADLIAQSHGVISQKPPKRSRKR